MELLDEYVKMLELSRRRMDIIKEIALEDDNYNKEWLGLVHLNNSLMHLIKLGAKNGKEESN